MCPGERWSFSSTVTTQSDQTLSIEKSQSTSIAADVTVGYSWSASLGVPGIAQTNVGGSIELSLSTTHSWDFSETDSQTTSNGKSETLTYDSGTTDTSRQCYLYKTNKKYEITVTPINEYTDDYGFTRHAPISATFSGSINSFEMNCKIVDSCGGVITGTFDDDDSGTRRRERRRLQDVNTLLHPCTLIGFDSNDTIVFSSQYGAELIENLDSLFTNITYLLLHQLDNEEEYQCNLYLTSNYSKDTEIYDMTVTKLDIGDNIREDDILDGILDVTNGNISQYGGILMVPESLICQVYLWDVTQTYRCGPFGVGNYGKNMLSAQSDICFEMLDIENNDIKFGNIEIEGKHNCIAQIYQDTSSLTGSVSLNTD